MFFVGGYSTETAGDIYKKKKKKEKPPSGDALDAF